MRRPKFIAIVVLVLLGTGIAVFLSTRDSGPPIKLEGNFTAKDVAQIKRVVHRELWHNVLPDLSKASIKGLPHNLKRAFATHVAGIRALDVDENGILTARVVFTTKSPGVDPNFGWLITNGPAGWSYLYLIYAPR